MKKISNYLLILFLCIACSGTAASIAWNKGHDKGYKSGQAAAILYGIVIGAVSCKYRSKK